MKLIVLRDHRRKTIEVTVGVRDPTLVADTAIDSPGRFGFRVEDLSREDAQRFGYAREEGVIITEVERGSVAALAGLKPGQLITEVNRERVSNAKDFHSALAASPKTNLVLLLVIDGELSRFVTLSVE